MMPETTTVLDQILAPRPGRNLYYFGCSSYAEFPPLPGSEVPGLRKSFLFDPDDMCDASPDAEWFIKFTERFPGQCWLIGYRTGDDREDRRVSIEGILVAAEDMTSACEKLLRSKR